MSTKRISFEEYNSPCAFSLASNISDITYGITLAYWNLGNKTISTLDHFLDLVNNQDIITLPMHVEYIA